MISRHTRTDPEDVFPRLLYNDSTCSQVCGRRSQAYGQRSQACCRHCQVLLGLWSALPDVSPALPVACGYTWRLLHRSSKLRDLTTLGFRSDNSQPLPEAPSDQDTFCWWKTENDSEMKKEAEDGKLHRMAKVHDFLEMWQGSRNLHATQKESCAQNKQMTAVGYISAMEDIVNASWSIFQHDGAAVFKLSERSPLPPPLSAKNLPGGRTQVLNIRWIQWINHYPVESDEDSTTESISDTEDWLNWNGDLDNLNDSEDDCMADVESDIEPYNSIKNLECPEQRAISAAPIVPRLIWPTWKLKRQAEMVLIMVSEIETRRIKGVKKKQNRTSAKCILVTENLQECLRGCGM